MSRIWLISRTVGNAACSAETKRTQHRKRSSIIIPPIRQLGKTYTHNKERRNNVLNSMGVSSLGSLAALSEHLAPRRRAVLSGADKAPNLGQSLTQPGRRVQRWAQPVRQRRPAAHAGRRRRREQRMGRPHCSECRSVDEIAHRFAGVQCEAGEGNFQWRVRLTMRIATRELASGHHHHIFPFLHKIGV